MHDYDSAEPQIVSGREHIFTRFKFVFVCEFSISKCVGEDERRGGEPGKDVRGSRGY